MQKLNNVNNGKLTALTEAETQTDIIDCDLDHDLPDESGLGLGLGPRTALQEVVTVVEEQEEQQPLDLDPLNVRYSDQDLTNIGNLHHRFNAMSRKHQNEVYHHHHHRRHHHSNNNERYYIHHPQDGRLDLGSYVYSLLKYIIFNHHSRTGEKISFLTGTN